MTRTSWTYPGPRSITDHIPYCCFRQLATRQCEVSSFRSRTRMAIVASTPRVLVETTVNYTRLDVDVRLRTMHIHNPTGDREVST